MGEILRARRRRGSARNRRVCTWPLVNLSRSSRPTSPDARGPGLLRRRTESVAPNTVEAGGDREGGSGGDAHGERAGGGRGGERRTRDRRGLAVTGAYGLRLATASELQNERVRKTTSGARTTKRYRAFPAEFGGSRVRNGPGEANSSGRAVQNSTWFPGLNSLPLQIVEFGLNSRIPNSEPNWEHPNTV
jgi:hypothetical protein